MRDINTHVRTQWELKHWLHTKEGRHRINLSSQVFSTKALAVATMKAQAAMWETEEGLEYSAVIRKDVVSVSHMYRSGKLYILNEEFHADGA